MKKRLLLFFILVYSGLFVNSQTQLIKNGNFSSSTGWTTSGNWYITSTFQCDNFSTGYAYAGNSSGQAVINETGDLKQTVTIPSTATSATFSFYVSASTDEVAISTVYDYVNVFLLNGSGGQLMQFTPTSIDNLNAGSPVTSCTAYNLKSFSIPSTYFGQSIQIVFRVHSDGGPKNTMFRIDDVSLTYIGGTNCTYSISPSSISPTSASGSGSVSVTITSGCSWTAISNNTSWLTVTSGSSGTGNGTVNYSYTENGTSSSRTGTITIGNKTFTVTQAGTTLSSQINGVDISHHNGSITWSDVASADNSFAYIKATEGASGYSYTSYFTNNIGPASSVLKTGAYHFGRPDNGNSAVDEANYFLSVVGSYMGNGYLPPALDIEDPAASNYLNNGHNLSQLAQWIQDWAIRIHTQTNVWPVLYCTKSYAQALYPYYQNGSNKIIDTNIKLWIAATSNPAGSPNTTGWQNWPWIFHQYFQPCDACASNDPTTGMDLNVFNGDITAFNNLIGEGSAPTATITNFTISPSTVCTGSVFTITNTLNASAAINNIILGATILPTGTNIEIYDISHDLPVSLPSGTSIKTRSFAIPPGTAPGTYDVVSGLWQDINNNGIIDPTTDIYLNSSTKVGLLTIPNSGCSSCTDQHESNNTVATASLVFDPPVATSSDLTWQGNIGFVDDDDWYRINTGTCGTVTVNLSNLPDDYDLELWNPFATYVLSESRNTGTSNETVSFSYQGSNTAFIKVYAKNHQSNTTSSCYNIQFIFTPCTGVPPPNDICTNATLLTVNTTCIPLTNQYLTNANDEGNGVVCDETDWPDGYDVWYKFVATNTTQNIRIDNGGQFFAHTAVYPDCSSARIDCAEGQGIISYTLNNLIIGHTYYIQIHDEWGFAQNKPFSICVYGNCNTPGAVNVNGQGTYCGSATLTAISGSGGTIYWQGKTSNGTSTATPSTSQTVTSSGTYYFRSYNSSCGWGTQGSATVTINTAPTAVNVSGGGTFCGNTVLTASGGSGGTIYWQGTTSNGTSTATASTSQTVNASGAYYFRSYNSSCGWGTQGSATVIINTASATAVKISANTGTAVCLGQSVTFSATPTNGGTAPTYQWKKKGANVATGLTYTTSSLINGDVITCVMTSNSFCASSSTATSNAITMSVNSSVKPSVSINANPSGAICTGQSVTFNATAVNGGTTPIYKWKIGNTMAGNNNPVFTTSNLTNGAVVTCELTSNAACADPATVTSLPITMQVNSAGTPSISIKITLGFNPTCIGKNVTFTATTTNGGTNPKYEWKVGNTVVGSNSPTYVVSNLTNGAVVTCTLTSNSSCGGSSTVTSEGITMSVSSPPPANIAAAGQITFCAGKNVLLKATTGTGYTYQWKKSGVDLPNETSSSYTAVTTGIYSVVLTNATGCSATSAGTHVTVNPVPVATVGAGVLSVCKGKTVPLRAVTGAGYTYQWRRGAAILPETSSTYIAIESGNYSVIVTNASGCKDTSAFFNVAINPLPLAEIKPNGPTTFCSKGEVILRANTGTGYTYQWKRGGAIIDGETSFTYKATTTGTYEVVVTNASGCSKTSPATTVLVNPLPLATITPPGPLNFCSPGTVVLKANTGTGYTYQWKKAGLNITENGTLVNYTAKASGIYSVAVTNSFGCTVISKTVTVTVNNAPVINLVQASSPNICAGQSVLLKATVGTGYTYKWRRSGILQPEILSTYLAKQTGVYTVEVTNAAGCSAVSLAITVTVTPLPVATIAPAGATTFCQGEKVQLKATVGAGYIYQWRKDGVNIPNEVNSTYNAIATGVYTVLVKNAQGCTGISNGIPVTVKPAPVTTITPNGPLSFKEGGSVSLSVPAVNGQLYQWKKNEINIFGQTSNSFLANATGSYSVSVTGVNGCVAISKPVQVSVTPGRPITKVVNDEKDFIKVYPNPLYRNEYLNIEWDIAAADKSILVIVSDITGRRINSQLLKSQDKKVRITGASGVYIVEFRWGVNQRKIFRVVKIE